MEPEELRYAGNLPESGSRLCVDFVNTVDWRLADYREERLASYADLVAWGRGAGILTAAQAESLLETAREHPAESDAAYRQAIRFREALYRIFAAAIAGESAAPPDLETVSAAVRRSTCGLRLQRAAGRYEFAWSDEELSLDGLLAPVAYSAAMLLTSEGMERLRQCAGDPCGWLFIDESRNRSRRWCSMSGCGNRAKARRHYERHREQGQAEPAAGATSAQ